MENRAKMDRADRAKQFMPFAALKGFEEALREKERVVVPRIRLTEEERDALDRKMQHIEKNDMITVIYFHEKEYLKVTGLVSRFDPTARVLRIVNTKIAFSDICGIEGDKFKEI